MWPFTQRQSLEKSGLLRGFVDYHSHILPDVDDGIKNMAESIKVLKKYEGLGVREVWLTPHIMEDIPNRTEVLKQVFDGFKRRYDGTIQLKLAAENMLDNLFEERIIDNDVIPIGNERKHLLVETSYFTPPIDFEGKLRRVFAAGYFPLLAHPERYVYMDKSDYDHLHESGVKMQLNLSSLFGFYGKKAKKKAAYMLKKGYYHALGSDIHKEAQLTISLNDGYLSKQTLEMLKNIQGID